jgi:outer membrane biosynthesis protein TonB
MLKKTLFVLLSTLVLSGVCFAQAEPAKEQMKETTPAVTQEQPAKEQMKETAPPAVQAEPAKEQMKETTPAVTQEQPAKEQMKETAPPAVQEQPAKEQMKETAPPAVQEQPAKEQMKETVPAEVQKQPALVLKEIHICAGVENREPTGVGTVFSDDLGKIYCFTKIGGAEGATYVYHVWYFENQEIAKVKLPVKSPSWRTWSSKTLNMGLGTGHVEIVSETGDVLGQAEFEIQAAEKAEEVEKTEKPEVSEEGKEAPKEQQEAPKEQ